MPAHRFWGILSSLLMLAIAGCATDSKFTPVTPETGVLKVGTLSFPPPTAGDWSYSKESSTGSEDMLIVSGGSDGKPRSVFHVWQLRSKETVSSLDELMEQKVKPFRDAVDGQRRFEVTTLECSPDETFSEVGVLCAVEGVDLGIAQPWEAETTSKPAIVRGHSYIFVHPADIQLLNVVEHGRQVLEGAAPANTLEALQAFAARVDIGE